MKISSVLKSPFHTENNCILLCYFLPLSKFYYEFFKNNLNYKYSSCIQTQSDPKNPMCRFNSLICNMG